VNLKVTGAEGAPIKRRRQWAVGAALNSLRLARLGIPIGDHVGHPDAGEQPQHDGE